MSTLPSNLAAELLKYLEPEEVPEPRRKRGRPKAHDDSQKLSRLLKAVAEIHSNNKALRSERSIAHALKKRSEYKNMSDRTLRRCVKHVLDWEMGLLKMTPTVRWRELLGISQPQGAMTEKALGEKAFELLRHQLRPHELLAQKQ
jgi:hypothetical protein